MPKTAVAAPARVPSSDESHWLDHLTRWREAGVCLAAYARSANLKVHRLYAWKSRLQTRAVELVPARRHGDNLEEDSCVGDDGNALTLPYENPANMHDS